MTQQNWTTFRKISTVCVVATLLGLFLAASNADAANKKSKPSAQGQANGIAHRVAALEALVAAQGEQIDALAGAVVELGGAIDDLQMQIDALDVRVEILETAAAAAADPTTT